MFRRVFRTRRRSERGVVAVEAALVSTLLLTMVFGIIEFAFLMKDDVALASGVRQGGRIASANAGAGPGGVSEGGDCMTPCTPANAPKFAQLAANAVQQAGSAMPKDSIDELWVYKANNKGFPGADGLTAMTCAASCVKYKWVASKDQFRYYSGTWISSTVNACANPPAGSPPIDAVGIYLLADHDFLSGIFAEDVNIEDHAVFVFEPLPTHTCGAGNHP